ncbi:MAG: tyrosinase family protein [Pseudomonadota bacterium]
MIPNHINRRTLLKTTAAAGAAAMAPIPARGAANYRRKNVNSPGAKRDVESYMKAVEVMLGLDPDHPHNWYRNAFTHLMDCPHGNWWFLAWHRGYLGYFEETCRKLSGDASFALPYWDWTADPEVPPVLFDTVLDPDNSSLYIKDTADFEKKLNAPMTAYWEGLTTPQRTEQYKRCFPAFETMWQDAISSFAEQPHGRFLTKANPKLDENTAEAVSIDTVLSALKPTIFAVEIDDKTPAFNSIITETHQTAQTGFSLLEGQPHNKVHNNTGGSVDDKGAIVPPYGFMTQFLSPIDPMFFLHHGNIDRLWDVWTRKQIAIGEPTGPADEDAKAFNSEPFLFYFDADENQVTSTAGEFLEIGAFDYDYEPGSGEEAIQVPVAALQAPLASSAVVSASSLSDGAVATINVPDALLKSVRAPSEERRQFARITFTPPMDVAGTSFRVFISPKDVAPDLSRDSVEYAGSFEFFGLRHKHVGPVTFTLGIDKTLDRMEAAGLLQPGQPISFTVIADGSGVSTDGKMKGTLEAVDVTVL